MGEPPVEEDFDDGEMPPEEDEKGPNRRCIASGEVKPAERMLRFVIGPDGSVVPDLEHRLPGRGIWVGAQRELVQLASAKNLFSKAARRKVAPPPDLADRIEWLLLRRCTDFIGLARRAGQAIMGYDKVRNELKAGRGALLLEASDGAIDGRGKIVAIAPNLPLVEVLTGEELGAAFGRDHAVHALLTRGKLADNLRIEAARLAGFRTFRPE